MYSMQFSTMTNTKTHQVSVRNIILSNKSKKELSVFWGDKKGGGSQERKRAEFADKIGSAVSHVCIIE